MMKIVYVHGLGGSGNGSSARNVESFVRKTFKEEIDFFAGTYNLLTPKKAFDQISADVQHADFIIASSLGGFYSSALSFNEESKTKIILLNPCLNPIESIPCILRDDQKAEFNQEQCLKEWKEIQSKWNENDFYNHKRYAGIFAKGDELFHYKPVFDKIFKADKVNSAEIEGVHEIAKHPDQLESAFVEAKKILLEKI